MGTLYTALTILLVFISIGITALVLLQKGKGADAGAAFGSGASGTVFGARGSTNFLSRSTAILAVGFFATCLGLAYLSAQESAPESLLDDVEAAAPADLDAPADVEAAAEDGLAIPSEGALEDVVESALDDAEAAAGEIAIPEENPTSEPPATGDEN